MYLTLFIVVGKEDQSYQQYHVFLLAYDDGSQCDTDSECFKFSKAPMSKDRLVRQIIRGSGKVLTSWPDIPVTNIKKTFVVSNRPCLTAIFIHCLARGIRLVAQDHIINCCKEVSQHEVIN